MDNGSQSCRHVHTLERRCDDKVDDLDQCHFAFGRVDGSCAEYKVLNRIAEART